MIDSDKPLPAVGAFWIEEADYPALLKVFDDGNTLPRTWKEWRKIAEEMEKGLKGYGHPVMRVRIDPATFPAWCAAHDTTPGPARAQAVRRRGGQGEIRRARLSDGVPAYASLRRASRACALRRTSRA
jgi:hypothetical protein